MHIIIQGESLYFAVYFFVFLRSQDLVVNLSRKKVDNLSRKIRKIVVNFKFDLLPRKLFTMYFHARSVRSKCISNDKHVLSLNAEQFLRDNNKIFQSKNCKPTRKNSCSRMNTFIVKQALKCVVCKNFTLCL